MVVVIIQARMGSTRLPGKVLREVNGRALLEIQYERVMKAKTVDKVVIATSTLESDDCIEEFCKKHDIECFRGDEQDVLKRYYDCAKFYKADSVIRLTGDCPLVSSETIDDVYKLYVETGADHVCNTAPVETNMFPNGSDVEILPFKILEQGYKEATSKPDREHVTFYFWKNPEKFKLAQLKRKEDYSSFRYTIDYPEDLEVVAYILEKLNERNLEGTVSEIVEILQENDEIQKLNNFHSFTAGWDKDQAESK